MHAIFEWKNTSGKITQKGNSASTGFIANFGSRDYFLGADPTGSFSIGATFYTRFRNDTWTFSLVVSPVHSGAKGACTYSPTYLTPDAEIYSFEYMGVTWYTGCVPYGWQGAQSVSTSRPFNTSDRTYPYSEPEGLIYYAKWAIDYSIESVTFVYENITIKHYVNGELYYTQTFPESDGIVTATDFSIEDENYSTEDPLVFTVTEDNQTFEVHWSYINPPVWKENFKDFYAALKHSLGVGAEVVQKLWMKNTFLIDHNLWEETEDYGFSYYQFIETGLYSNTFVPDYQILKATDIHAPLSSEEVFDLQSIAQVYFTKDYIKLYATALPEYDYTLFVQGGIGCSSVPDIPPGPQPEPFPEGFTRLDYIESSGTQYINLNYVPKENSIITVTAKYLEAASSTKCILGVENSSSRGIVWFGARYTNFLGQLDFSTEVPVGTFDQKKHTHKIDCLNKTYTFDGGSPILLSSTFIDPIRPMYLFAHDNIGLTQLVTKLRVYDLSIYEGETEVMHLAPAIRDSDGVVCMVDLITETPYLNAGSGAFIPSDTYTKLDYIESTGTQYFDLGIQLSDNIKIATDIACLSASSCIIWSGEVSNGGSNDGLFALSGYFYTQMGPSAAYWATYAVADTTRHVHIVDFKNKTYSIDATKYDITHSISYLQGISPYLLAINTAGTSVRNISSAKVYSVKVYDGTDLIMDLIPARRDSDGELCLFDLVTRDPYLNKGTGKFIPSEFAPTDFTLGAEYTFGVADGTSYTWKCCEILDNHVVLVNATPKDAFDGKHASYVMSGPSDGSESWNGANTVYGKDIDGRDIHTYSEKMSTLYDSMKAAEYTEAPYGKGFYLISKDKAPAGSYYHNTIMNASGSGWHGWIGTANGSDGQFWSIRNNTGYAAYGFSYTFNNCPCFNLDPKKITLSGTTIYIK